SGRAEWRSYTPARKRRNGCSGGEARPPHNLLFQQRLKVCCSLPVLSKPIQIAWSPTAITGSKAGLRAVKIRAGRLLYLQDLVRIIFVSQQQHVAERAFDHDLIGRRESVIALFREYGLQAPQRPGRREELGGSVSAGGGDAGKDHHSQASTVRVASA